MRDRPTALMVLTAWMLAHIVLGTAIWFTSAGAETVWFHNGRWLTGVQDSDSWKPIELAWASAARQDGGIYADVFFGQGVKFQYPPPTLILFGGVSRSVLNVVSWTATLATAVVAALLLNRALVSQAGAAQPDRSQTLAITALATVAVLTFYPVVKAYSLGQVQTLVTALFAVVLLAWQRGRTTLAGVALGLMLLIKPTGAPVLLWGLLRRQWRFAGAAVGTAIAGLLFSLAHATLRDYVDYVRVLSYIGARGELFYPNQSVNGVLNRLVADGGSLTWSPAAFPAPHPFVAVGTLLAAVLLIGSSLTVVPRGARGSMLDLCAIALASTMATPIAWEHHYGVLAPILAATTPIVVALHPAGRLTGALLAGATLVAANFFQVAHRFDATLLNPLQSYLLAAALVVWAMLVGAARVRA